MLCLLLCNKQHFWLRWERQAWYADSQMPHMAIILQEKTVQRYECYVCLTMIMCIKWSRCRSPTCMLWLWRARLKTSLPVLSCSCSIWVYCLRVAQAGICQHHDTASGSCSTFAYRSHRDYITRGVHTLLYTFTPPRPATVAVAQRLRTNHMEIT